MKIPTRLLPATLGVAAALALITPASAQWTNYIEVEDYNFGSGQFMSGATNGMDGPYLGGAYTNLAGTADVDFHIVTAHGTGSSTPYRASDYTTYGLYTSRQMSTTYDDANRSYFRVSNNWKISWQEPGEWQNYTRVFSNAVYDVTLRAGHNTSWIKMELALVTSDPTQPNQTTETLGWTDAPPPDPADVNHFFPISIVDAFGQPIRIRLSGMNTLRLTQRAASNLDWLRFIALPEVTVMPPYTVSAAPAPEETLTAMKPINVTIRRGDFPVNPASVRLSVNGSDVTSAVVVTTNATGAVVYYDYDRGLPTAAYVPVELIYGDTGNPATLVTNTWNFTTPPTWPIIMSPTSATLYTNQLSDNVTVSIPLGMNAGNDVQVDLTSSDPSVAAPAGGSSGILSLVFPAGGTNVKTFKVQSVGEGTAEITTQNGWGLDVATLNVSVPPILGVSVQSTPAPAEQYRGGTVTIQATATGMSPIHYQWQQNGANLPGETNAALVLNNVNAASSYRVVVTNAAAIMTSSEVAVTLLPDPAQAFVLYRDSFSGSGGLDGRSPEINRLSGTWTAASGIIVTNEAYVPSGGSWLGFLPFTPEVGHVYVVSLDMNPLTGGNEWCALGLTAAANTTQEMWANSPGAWMLQRYNRSGSQMFANGGNFAGPGGHEGYTTWKIVLDTTTGDASSGWTVRFVQGLAGSFGNVLWTQVCTANPTISYLGFGVENAGVSGNFDNLLVTDSVLPPGALAIQKSGGNATLNWSQGLLLEATSLTGPWTTNSASPPSLVVPTTATQKFYRVIVP